MKILHRLETRIRDYEWGSRTVLSSLRGAPPAERPEAELWIGAHPAGESILELDGRRRSLSEVVRERPERWLGERGHERFGSVLPFLLKILAVEQPLSLQAHPDLAAAAAGLAREASLDASERSYVDAGHKPELVVALEPFWALRGLRPAAEIHQALRWLEPLAPALLEPLAGGPAAARLGEFLGRLLGTEKDAWDRMVDGLGPFVAAARGDLTDPWHWVGVLLDLHPRDPACLSPLVLHLVELRPGQALYQAPGTLHCYLQGAGVEVMASSDNVLRGGLTPKRRDVAELLRVGDLRPSPRQVLDGVGEAGGVRAWRTPADEFRLIELLARSGTARWRLGGAIALAVCTRGVGRLAVGSEGLDLRGGDAVVAAASTGELCLESAGEATVFLATLPP